MSDKLSNLPALPTPITTGDNLYVIRGGVSYKADSGDIPSGGAAESVADTGTIINLGNPLGIASNMATPNTNGVFTVTGEVVNGWNQVKINRATEPTFSDVSIVKEEGMTFIPNTIQYLNVRYNGTETVYFFSPYIVPAPINIKEDEIFGTRVTASVSGTYDIDLDDGSVWVLTMTADTTFSFLNLPTGTDTQIIEVLLQGNFTPTFPAYVENVPSSDTYLGTVRNRYIFDIINGITSSEDILATIENLS